MTNWGWLEGLKDLLFPSEKKLLQQGDTKDILGHMTPCLKSAGVSEIQEKTKQVHHSDALLEYVQNLLDFTRTSPHFHMGLSPRAGLAILRAAATWAFLDGRDYTLPEDVQRILPVVAGHRLRSSEDLLEYPRDRLISLLKSVPIP